MADGLQGLLDAGLQHTTIREWPYSNGGKPFDEMHSEPGRRWRLPDCVPAPPLMLSLAAQEAVLNESSGSDDDQVHQLPPT